MWKANLQRLQREISVISRVVVHPKYRSIGLGARLVGETLAQAGTPCVEAVAVMAKYNPFFGRAGMRKIAESKPSVHVAAALERLGELGFDSALLADVVYGKRVVSEVGREAVLDVFEELSRCDAGVRRRLECLHSVYPRHEEFMAKAAGFKVLLLHSHETPSDGQYHAATAVHLTNAPEKSLPNYADVYFTYNGENYYYAETTQFHWRVGDLPPKLENITFNIVPVWLSSSRFLDKTVRLTISISNLRFASNSNSFGSPCSWSLKL